MRPYLICHMYTSIDGGLHPSLFTEPAEGVSAQTLKAHYDGVAERLDADGWIVGRRTMSEMAKGEARPAADAPTIPREPHAADRGGRGLAVAIDPSGKVHYGKDEIGGDHVVAVLGEGVSDAYLAELREDGVSYVFAGPGGLDLDFAMQQLHAVFGARRLLLEGGGRINAAFFRARLIDEFSTLIYPGVEGLANSQGIVDHEGKESERPGAGQLLRLVGCKQLEGGAVWLRHKVESAPEAAR